MTSPSCTGGTNTIASGPDVPVTFTRKERHFSKGQLDINKGIAMLKIAREAGDENLAAETLAETWSAFEAARASRWNGHRNPEWIERVKKAHILAATGQWQLSLDIELGSLEMVRHQIRGEQDRAQADDALLRRQEAVSSGNCCEYLYRLAMKSLEGGDRASALDSAQRSVQMGHAAFEAFPDDDAFYLDHDMGRYSAAKAANDRGLLEEVSRSIDALRLRSQPPSLNAVGFKFALEHDFFRSMRHDVPAVDAWIKQAEKLSQEE